MKTAKNDFVCALNFLIRPSILIRGFVRPSVCRESGVERNGVKWSGME